MAFKINVDSNSYSSQAEKTADNYVLTIAKKLINDEAGARESEDSSLSRRIDKNLDSIESLNEFRTAATEELSEKELLANKTEYISTAPSHEKYPTEQAVAEYVAGLGEENGGHVHPNKQALDTIYEEDIQRWDRAAENVGGIALMPLAERVNTLIDDVDSAEAEIEALSGQINSLTDELSTTKAEIEDLKTASSTTALAASDNIVRIASGTTFAVKRSGVVRVFVGAVNRNYAQTVYLKIVSASDAGIVYANVTGYFAASTNTQKIQADVPVSPGETYKVTIAPDNYNYMPTISYVHIGACVVDSSLVY